MFEGTKKAATTKMGHKYVFFLCFFILTTIFRFYLRYEGVIRVRGGQGQRKRAQTTRQALFGP